jgi:hypothetical protein
MPEARPWWAAAEREAAHPLTSRISAAWRGSRLSLSRAASSSGPSAGSVQQRLEAQRVVLDEGTSDKRPQRRFWEQKRPSIF